MSLGGKGRAKAAESKNEFLERTRKERDEREAQRRREKAVLKLQVSRRVNLQCTGDLVRLAILRH